MNKLVQLCLALLCFSTTVFSQKELILRKAETAFFLEHTVVSKDNFYSLGRLYNVSARSIATFNRIDMNKGLNIDQKVRIPLTDTNFTQAGNSGTPVYYRAGLNTTLTRISDAYRKVPVENLRSWNQRSIEEVAEGEKLIIGFLLSKEMPSVTLNSPPVRQEKDPEVTEVITVSNKEETNPAPPDGEIVTAPKKEEPQPAKDPEPVKTEDVKEQGYFKTAFEQQVKQIPLTQLSMVTSGIFKTSSGWEDGKYYVLVDNVQPGTIVRLINPTNNRNVYAKVLGEMSGIRLNEGLDIRVSNSAASVLEISETDKFILKLHY